ncbi:MAG: InlB B-repeat-containing protein [Endomicrobium sp.]|nr:InlB B-repeat-containing protein [Endomicrobium sp.]
MITTSISTTSSTQLANPPPYEQVQLKPEEESTATAAQEEHGRESVQEKREVKLLAYYGVANVDFARMIGITGSDDEITSILEDSQETRFGEDIPKVSEIFKNDISKEGLISELLKTNYSYAVIAALALKELNLTDQEFQDILAQAKSSMNDHSAFFNLQKQLTAKIESGLIDKISQGEDVSSVLTLPFPSFNILQLKNMLRLKIISEQEVKSLVSTFKGEKFFEELKNIISQKVIASQEAEVSKALSQEDINTANSFIQLCIPELDLNENPIDIAKAMYGLMIVANLYDNIGLKKEPLTKEKLKNVLNYYFHNLITKETINSFFEGDINPQEAVKKVMEYLLNKLNHMRDIKVVFLQNRIHLNQNQILSTNNQQELSNQAKVLDTYENELKQIYKKLTGDTANTLYDVLIKEPNTDLKFKLSMSAVDIMIARSYISKVIDGKDNSNSLNTKLKNTTDFLKYLTELSDFLTLPEHANQLNEVNQKIRVLSNDSIDLNPQRIISVGTIAKESIPKFPILAFIKALSIKDSLGIDTTNPVYTAIEHLNSQQSEDNLSALIDSFKIIISTNNNNQADFNKIAIKFQEGEGDEMPPVSEFISMLSFVTNDLVENANGDITKLKLAVLISTMLTDYAADDDDESVESSILINTIYNLIESLNLITNSMNEKDENRIVLKKKLQELFVMSFPISSIYTLALENPKAEIKQHARFLPMLEKEKQILQSFKDKKVISDDEILKIVRRKEMLMKNFIDPVIGFHPIKIQTQIYRFNIYQTLISSYNELISNMSSPQLLATLSWQNKFRNEDTNEENVRKIISKLKTLQEITGEEIAYLESIKNTKPDTDLHKKIRSELISVITLNLQVDAKMPTDFINKVLNESELKTLFDELKNYRDKLLDPADNTKEIDFATSTPLQKENFRYAIARLDKILATIIYNKNQIKDVFGDDTGYFFVTKISNDKDTLEKFVKNEKQNIEYRLYAYGYLKAMGIDDLDSYVQEQKFLDKVKEMLQAKKLKVGNNYFDLRVCEIAINIIASNEVLNKVITIDDTKVEAFKSFTLETYRQIMNSNFLPYYSKMPTEEENANSGLTFTFASNTTKDGLDLHDRMYRTIAHELGHRQLYALGVFTKTDAKSSSMFHEFFADIVAGMFMSKFLGRTVEGIIAGYSDILQPYVAFSTHRKEEAAADEGHAGARGLINAINQAFELAGKTMNYETILKVSIKIAGQAQSEGLFVEKQEENLAKKIITTIATATADFTGTQEDRGEFLYQFIEVERKMFKDLEKGEAPTFNTLEEEREIFGLDEQGQKNLYYYLVAKQKHKSKFKLIIEGIYLYQEDLYQEESQFMEDYRNGKIIPLANVQNTPIFQQPLQPQPVLVPLFEKPIDKQELFENEATAAESTIGNTAKQTELQELTQEETQEGTQKTTPIDDSKKVEAFVRLVRDLPFEIQHRFVKAVLGNDALTARFIRIISTSDEVKWKNELYSRETSFTDIRDAIKASFTLEQGTMKTTEDAKIEFNFEEVQRSLENGRSGIISLRVKSMRELDHISYIEAKDFKGFKNRLKAFIHKRLGFLERVQTFITGVWRFVSLHITTSNAARKFTTEWGGISVTWIPPYGIDLPDTLQDARIDDEGRLVEPFVLYGKQRFAGNRRGTITRIVRATYKNGTQAYLKNFKPGQRFSDDIASVEISYNFESETCEMHFDMGNIDDGYTSPHPLVKGIRNHDVGNGYHVDGLGNNLPNRKDHKLLGCRYITTSGEIITISEDGLKNGFDIAGEELSGDLSIQLIWEPIVHVVNVEFYDRDDRQELKRGKQQINVIAGHDARIKGLAPGTINAAANLFNRFFTGLRGETSGIVTHTITWAKLPEGLSWPDNYNTFGLTEDFASTIEDGVTLETPPMRLGHIMLPNGRLGTVRCKVIDVDNNQEIEDFQMGKTPVDRDLRIEYEFTPDKADYSLTFEANGGTLEEQPEIEVNSEGQAVIPGNITLPTRAGYVFKGYQMVKCSHISLFNINVTDEYKYMTIKPEQLHSGIILEGIVGDLILVAQWEEERASSQEKQSSVIQEETQEIKHGLSYKVLYFIFVTIILGILKFVFVTIIWRTLKFTFPYIVNAAIGKYGRVLQIVSWALIVGAIYYFVKKIIVKYIMHPTKTMLKIAAFLTAVFVIFVGFSYLNELEKVLFVTSLGLLLLSIKIFPIVAKLSVLVLGGPYLSIVLLLLVLLAAGFFVYAEFKMKKNWWNWAKRTFAKVFKFIFLASGKTFRKSVQIAKIAAGEPIKYAINLYDNMSNIADNLSEIPVREGYEFGGLKIVGTDKVFTVEDMKRDFVVPHQFFDGTNTIKFEYVWLLEMKASFLPGTTAQVQNMTQEITKDVLRGKKFKFPGFRQAGILNAALGYNKYTVPTREGYDFDGLVVKIADHEDLVKERDVAMAGFEIPKELMTGPVSFEMRWKAQEGTVEEEDTAQPEEAQASQEQAPQLEQAEESAQPELEQREEEIGQFVLPEKIEIFAKLVRELPFDIQYRFIVAVFGIDNMPLVAKFIGSISTPTESWRWNLFKQQADREKILEILDQRSNALQPMVATDDARIIINLDQIKGLLEERNRQGIRSLIVQATSGLDRLPYMDAAIAIKEAQRAAKNAEETAKRSADAKEEAQRADYEAETSNDPEKITEAQKAAETAKKTKAKAEAASRIAKETAEAVTTSTRIRAFIHNNLRFLETFIIFTSSIFVRMTLSIKTSSIARKFTTEWGDVSVTWIPPEGLELQDSVAIATIDEEGRLIEPAVIYGKQKLAGNRRGTVQKIVRITDSDGNLKYLDNFQTGDRLPEGTKAVEVFYNFIPDTCKIRLDMGAIDAQNRFENSPLVKGIGDHEVGMGYHVDGFGKDLPVRTGYKLLGCRYTTMNGQIIYIPLKLLKKGFDITGQELSGDLNIQLIWEPNVNDAKIQFFDGDIKQALEGNIKVVQGHGARIKGLAPSALAAFANWIRRLGTGLAAGQSGVKTHKISWAKLPPGLDWPDNYQTDGLNEDFISNIEDEVVLEEPPMRTGRIMLVDGRVATVVCEVKNANTGEILKNFQFGRTPIKGNLRIEYRIIEEEKYSLHFEANGAILDSHPLVNYDIKKNVANVQASDIPIRNGYVFKGYTVIKCTHQTILGVSLGDNSYETKEINPAEVRSGFIIENVFGDVVLVAQWEKEQTLITIQQQPVSKGVIPQALTAAWAIAKGAWGHLSARQKITFVFAGIILLAAGTMSFLLTYGIIVISFSFFISIGLYIIGGIASFILIRLIYVMIKGFLLGMLKAIGNFLTKSFKFIVLAGGKTFRRSYRVTRQVFRAPINYAKNFYENMTNIADNLSTIPTREGYEFGGFSVTNDTTRETAEFSLQEIKRDFIVPGKYFSQNEAGESIVKLKYIWLPKVTITTGAGTNARGKQKSLELFSREINLAGYKDSLIAPEGYDYASLYWTCDAYPDEQFAATATVNVDKPCAFTPHWKFLPKAIMSVGNGTWKNAYGDDATNKRPVTVTATRQGAMANLREMRDALEAPDDCDPDSLYFTEADRDAPIEENEAGEVLIKSDTLYTPRWKTLTESNKVKLKIGEGQSIILSADEKGFIDLDAVVRDRELKPPQDFTEKFYWTANGKKNTKLTGKIDIKHTSVLTLHWEAFDREAADYYKAEEIMFGQEGAEELAQLDFFPTYTIELHSGVESGSIDDVTPNLAPDLQTFLKSTKLPKGQDFSFSFKKNTPTRTGYRFKGVLVETDNYRNEFLGTVNFTISGKYVTGHIRMTLLWEKEYPVTSEDEQLSAALGDLNAYENNDFKFRGFGGLIPGFKGYPIPTKTGFKFRGVRVKIGDKEEEHLGTGAFTISGKDITDTIFINYLWDQETTQEKIWWRRRLWKSQESAQGAAQAAAEIGMLLGTQTAGSMFAVNGSVKLIKSTLDSFADLERSQGEQIREAQTLVSQNNYFKEKPNEEILRQLLSDSKLSPEDISIFLKLLSEVDIEVSGEVMSYEPNTQESSKPGKIHVNYKMLRAMFLDANGNTQNIELFKVFIKHELTHMEFSISNNPLYKAAHSIPFLEEFLVSLSDLYVWQQAQLILPEYIDIIKFIFTNARILSVAAGISIKEAERISKLYTGLPQREMSIELLKTTQGDVANSSTSALKPLILFVANSSDGRLTPASSYVDNFAGASSNYAAAVVEHIPSNVLVPTGYSRRISVNVSFNDLVYDVYVRNIEGKCFIGLKLKSGVTLEQNADISAKNFAAAAQFFANDLNTNSVLREEFNRVTNIGISQEGVAMMDFLGFPDKITEQEDVQKLYQPESIESGLVGVHSVENLVITSENITSVEQDIKASKLLKLDKPEKFYEVDITYARLSNTYSIKKIVNIKKKEGATTIILNIKDFDIDTLLSENTKELLVEAISIIHSMDLTCTIQLDITKATEEMFKQFLELGFDGISIDAQNQDVKDISFIKELIDSLITVSINNSISEKNTIHLKNKAVRDLLGDLSNSNILTITNIDPETYEASIDETGALSAMEIGYEIGHRVLEQNIKVNAENMRVLLNIFNNTHTNITVNEIREAVIKAGLNPILQKHIEIILNGVANNETGANYKVAQAIGFVRGLVESYAIGMYLETFDITFEAFNENNINDKIALRTLLTALFIIDRNNTFFKDSTTLKTFFEQAKSILDNSSIDGTLSDISKQITLFVNSVILRFEEEKGISDLLLIQSTPSQKLYISLAILNDSINKVSFRRVVDETIRRTKSSALAVKNILGAA